MTWNSQPPQFWLGLAVLLAAIAATICVVFNKKPDARMDFFLHLIESITSEETPTEHEDEARALKERDNT